MLSLISWAHQYFTQKQTYTILIIGPEKSGKTTLLNLIKSRYSTLQPQPFSSSSLATSVDNIKSSKNYIPTLGLNLIKVDYSKSTILKIQDLGGTLEMRQIWKNYYKQTDYIIFVFNLQNFEDCLLEFEKMLNETNKYNIIKMLLIVNLETPNVNIEGIIKQKFSKELIELMVTKECQIFDIDLLQVNNNGIYKKIDHIMENIVQKLNSNLMKM